MNPERSNNIVKKIQPNNPDANKIELAPKVKDDTKEIIGFQRSNLTGFIQRARGKENIKYIDSKNNEFFAKYVDLKENTRDNIEGLKHEKYFLDLLSDSGVTPKNSELKIYSNGKRARLIMDHIEGVSLDCMPYKQADKFIAEKADEIIHSTAETLDKIYKKNVLLVDLNEGSFLFYEKDGRIMSNIVDFELALDLNNPSPEDKMAAHKWYSSHNKDLGLSINSEMNKLDSDVLRKAEIYLWAETLVSKMISYENLKNSIDLPVEKQGEFDLMKEKIGPTLKNILIESAKKDYASISERSSKDNYFFSKTESEYVEKEIERKLPKYIEEALIGITLKEKIDLSGIALSGKTINFMSRALSLDLKNRPSSFDELLF